MERRFKIEKALRISKRKMEDKDLLVCRLPEYSLNKNLPCKHSKNYMHICSI